LRNSGREWGREGGKEKGGREEIVRRVSEWSVNQNNRPFFWGQSVDQFVIIFSYSGEYAQAPWRKLMDSAVLSQAPVSTAALHKLHKSLTKSAENSCSASHLWQSWRYSGRRTEEKEAQRLRNSHNLRRLDWGVVERTRAWQLLAHAHNVRASLCCPVKLYRFPQTRYRVLAVR
jgi:hypothetical protein